MKFFKFRNINKRFLIPVFGGLITLVYRIIMPKIPKYDIVGKNPFISNIYVSLGLIWRLFLILYLSIEVKYLLFQKHQQNQNLI